MCIERHIYLFLIFFFYRIMLFLSLLKVRVRYMIKKRVDTYFGLTLRLVCIAVLYINF